MLVVFTSHRSRGHLETIYCPLRTWSSVNTPFPQGIEPRAVAWQSITLPLRHASSTLIAFKCTYQRLSFSHLYFHAIFEH